MLSTKAQGTSVWPGQTKAFMKKSIKLYDTQILFLHYFAKRFRKKHFRQTLRAEMAQALTLAHTHIYTHKRIYNGYSAKRAGIGSIKINAERKKNNRAQNQTTITNLAEWE